MFNNDHGRTVPAVSARLDWADRAMSAGCPLDSQGGVGVRIAPPDHGCDQHVAIAIGVPATAGVELDPVDVAGLPRLRRLNLGDSRHLDHQELPTAVHDVAEVHDTPLSALPMVIAGLGVGCMVQADPSQTSATVAACPDCQAEAGRDARKGLHGLEARHVRACGPCRSVPGVHGPEAVSRHAVARAHGRNRLRLNVEGAGSRLDHPRGAVPHLRGGTVAARSHGFAKIRCGTLNSELPVPPARCSTREPRIVSQVGSRRSWRCWSAL